METTTTAAPIKYRDHRGGLEESTKTEKTFNSLDALIAHINASFRDIRREIDEISFQHVGQDIRVGWDSWYVLVKLKSIYEKENTPEKQAAEQHFVAGISNGSFPIYTGSKITWQIKQSYGRNSGAYDYFDADPSTDEEELKRIAIQIINADWDRQSGNRYALHFPTPCAPTLHIAEYCNIKKDRKRGGRKFKTRWR